MLVQGVRCNRSYMDFQQCHCYSQNIQVLHHYLASLAVEVKILLNMEEQQIVGRWQPMGKQSQKILKE